SYSGIANYWKFFDGESKQLKKYNVFETKKKDEQKFIEWAKNKAEYKDIFNNYASNYETWTPYARMRVYTMEGILGSPLTSFASSLMQVERVMADKSKTAEDISKAVESASNARQNYLKGSDVTSDEIIMAKTAQMFYNDVDKSHHPAGFYENVIGKYGSLNEEGTYKKWARDVFANTIILDSVKWAAFAQKPDLNTLANDPAIIYATAFTKNYTQNYSGHYSKFTNANNELDRLYMKGIMEMNPAA